VPYRGTITIDRDRVVTSTFFQRTWQEHTTMSSVLLSLGKDIDVPATRVSTPHLTATAFTSDQAVAPGAHFLVVMDVTPAPGMHVYAPGAAPYPPIAFALTERLGLVVRPLRFPPSEDHYFKPLDEHVPVYQRPFRITQEVMVDPSRAGQAALKGADRVTIAGALEYQACDATECFLPQAIPFTWTVALRLLDNTRIVTTPAESTSPAEDRR
jgi:DsbC/DsbD-like thiol-disulfide interchange protein